MSKTLTNVRDTLSALDDDIQRKHAELYRELEEDLEELDEYRELFDDAYDARGCKSYYEEMSDIFDDEYEAQQAKELIDQLSYEGIDDFSDFESFADTLRDEIKDELDEARTEEQKELIELRRKYEEAKELIVRLEDERFAAITALRGTTIEQAEIDRTASEEKAYECGLNDGLIARRELEQAKVDFDITEEDK